MRRTQLIEWGIIVIALIFGYKFFEGIISLFIQTIYLYDSGQLATGILRMVLIIGFYAVAFILLIKNSHKAAAYLSGPGTAENSLPVKISKRSLLQVILISICVFTILTNIADTIYYIFDLFRQEVQRKGMLENVMGSSASKYNFAVHCMEIVIALIAIYFSKNIADALIRKDEAEELAFDSKPEN